MSCPHSDTLYYQYITRAITDKPNYFKHLDEVWKSDSHLIYLSQRYKRERTEFKREQIEYTGLYEQNPTAENALIAIEHGMNFWDLGYHFLGNLSFMRAALAISPHYNKIKRDIYKLHPPDPIRVLAISVRENKTFMFEILTDEEYRSHIAISTLLELETDIYVDFIHHWDTIICFKTELCRNTSLLRAILHRNMRMFDSLDSKYKSDLDWCREVLKR